MNTVLVIAGLIFLAGVAFGCSLMAWFAMRSLERLAGHIADLQRGDA